MKLHTARSGSPRLIVVSPLGRSASGPWRGPFGSNSDASDCETPKTVYVSEGGQCYSDLDGSIALSHNGSMDTGPLVDPHKHAEAPSSAQSSVGDNPVADLAVLMEIERGPRAHSVPAKLKPARDTGAAAPRCSNKMLRSINSLCQPRK